MAAHLYANESERTDDCLTHSIEAVRTVTCIRTCHHLNSRRIECTSECRQQIKQHDLMRILYSNIFRPVSVSFALHLIDIDSVISLFRSNVSR